MSRKFLECRGHEVGRDVGDMRLGEMFSNSIQGLFRVFGFSLGTVGA